MSTNVAEWLRGLGLERFAAAFTANDIDGEVLTAIDGRRPARAWGSLDWPAAAAAGGDGRSSPGRAAARSGSRVCRCALRWGRTPAAERDVLRPGRLDSVVDRSDPEDLREVIGAYHRAVAEVVARFAGFVAKYMGDGVLVYFGYPQAHEDDAERAVRAGLAVIEAVGGLATPEPLKVRLGIASGLVVVGDLIGAGAAQERVRRRDAEPRRPAAGARAIGHTRDWREHAAADRRLVRVGRSRRAAARRFFRAAARLARGRRKRGFEPLRGAPLGSGAAGGLDLLLRRWQQAKAGEGRVVLISGEPGIGKSRLTAELDERIASEPHTRLRYFCSPHHQDSGLYPFIVQLERAAGFARDDTAETKLGKLRELLAPGARGGDENRAGGGAACRCRARPRI